MIITKPGTLTARIGVIPGDIIVSVNGTEVKNAAHLQKLVQAKSPAWTIILGRGAQTLTLKVN